MKMLTSLVPKERAFCLYYTAEVARGQLYIAPSLALQPAPKVGICQRRMKLDHALELELPLPEEQCFADDFENMVLELEHEVLACREMARVE
jgi:hypothetical protein